MKVILEYDELAVKEDVELMIKRLYFMIKWCGKVYTQIVKSCSAKELLAIVKEKTPKESSIYTDTFRTYDGLVNMVYKKHYRIAYGN